MDIKGLSKQVLGEIKETPQKVNTAIQKRQLILVAMIQ